MMRALEDRAAFVFQGIPDDDERGRMATVIGAIDSAANQANIVRSDAERLAEIRAYIAEYRRDGR